MDKFDITKYPQIKWIAHRGIPSQTYENTITGFKIAANLPYYGIETDVHETKDSAHILHHDDFIKVNEKEHMIKDLSSHYLRDIKFNNGDTLPYLSEYIKICKAGKKIAVVEFKASFSKESIESILNEIESLEYLNQTIIISFIPDNLRFTRSLNKTIPIQFLIGEYNLEAIEFAKDMKFAISMHYSLLTKERVNLYHSYGLEVNCWTIRDVKSALEMIEIGVDYITTDGF